MSHEGIQKLKQSKGMALFVPLPCESGPSLLKHAEAFQVNPFLLKLFKKMSEVKGFCCWVTCPLFGDCPLDGWGSQIKEREIIGDLLVEMADDLVNGFHPFSAKEETFLLEMLERFEMNEKFIPSERQSSWVEALHSRYTEKKKGF